MVEYQIRIDARFDQVDARFEKIEGDVANIKATMVTKDDLTSLRSLDQTGQGFLCLSIILAEIR